jgi:hypothetical protein
MLLQPKINYRQDYLRSHSMNKKCSHLKSIETLICVKCIKRYIKDPSTNPPVLWWGISNEEWLPRYD